MIPVVAQTRILSQAWMSLENVQAAILAHRGEPLPDSLNAEIASQVGKVRESIREIIEATPHELRFPCRSGDGALRLSTPAESFASWCALTTNWLRPKIERSRAAGQREITLPARDIEKLLNSLESIASRRKGGSE